MLKETYEQGLFFNCSKETSKKHKGKTFFFHILTRMGYFFLNLSFSEERITDVFFLVTLPVIVG